MPAPCIHVLTVLGTFFGPPEHTKLPFPYMRFLFNSFLFYVAQMLFVTMSLAPYDRVSGVCGDLQYVDPVHVVSPLCILGSTQPNMALAPPNLPLTTTLHY